MPDDDSTATSTSDQIQGERDRHMQRRTTARPDASDEDPEADASETPSPEDGEEQEATTEPRVFTVVRRSDESGVSGTGRVLDGCIFHSGQVVICWRGDINSEKSGYSSLAIYPCWEAFHNIHIGAHPENETEVVFGHEADLMARIVDRAAERESETETSE